MTLQQIEYALALEKHRSFTKAAQSTYVTQPTLTMQIRKLEQEIDTEIFDRSTSPITLTKEGRIFIEHAMNIMAEVKALYQQIKASTDLVEGTFRLGIIPTVAPYLLPLFLGDFQRKYPNTCLDILEVQTKDMIEAIRTDELDFGIAATPLQEKDIQEIALYEEPFLLYTHDPEHYDTKPLLAEDIRFGNLLMLDQGHCFREQIISLCHHKDQFGTEFSFNYLGGSIEGLKNIVDQGIGETLIPLLATQSIHKKERLIAFAAPQPARQISLLVHRRNNYHHLTDILNDIIISSLPDYLTKGSLSKKIVEWH